MTVAVVTDGLACPRLVDEGGSTRVVFMATVVVVTVTAAVGLVPAVVLLVIDLLAPLLPRCQEGSSTGVSKTMMTTIAARHAPAMARSLRLRSRALKRTARKKPLSKKNRAMLTELFTLPAYQTEPNPGS